MSKFYENSDHVLDEPENSSTGETTLLTPPAEAEDKHPRKRDFDNVKGDHQRWE
jgi:hypothetical protein